MLPSTFFFKIKITRHDSSPVLFRKYLFPENRAFYMLPGIFFWNDCGHGLMKVSAKIGCILSLCNLRTIIWAVLDNYSFPCVCLRRCNNIMYKCIYLNIDVFMYTCIDIFNSVNSGEYASSQITCIPLFVANLATRYDRDRRTPKNSPTTCTGFTRPYITKNVCTILKALSILPVNVKNAFSHPHLILILRKDISFAVRILTIVSNIISCSDR